MAGAFLALERGGQLEFQPMIINRVVEGQTRAMQHEAVGQRGVAIQAVTDDGVAESLRVSRMDSQLMGAARQRREAYPCEGRLLPHGFLCVRGPASIRGSASTRRCLSI